MGVATPLWAGSQEAMYGRAILIKAVNIFSAEKIPI